MAPVLGLMAVSENRANPWGEGVVELVHAGDTATARQRLRKERKATLCVVILIHQEMPLRKGQLLRAQVTAHVLEVAATVMKHHMLRYLLVYTLCLGHPLPQRSLGLDYLLRSEQIVRLCRNHDDMMITHVSHSV